jgi:dienelactone hydrolase
VLVGESDVWTPAAPCRALIESASEGSKAQIQVYPGAYHDFDWPDLPVHEVPAFRTRAGVVPIEGTDTAAQADALQRVPGFLKSYLSAP